MLDLIALLRQNPAIAGQVIAVSTVPEKKTWAMLMVGIGMLGMAKQRRRAPCELPCAYDKAGRV